MAIPLPLDFVQSIEVSALEYPLYDHFANPVKCFFALGPKIIWDLNNKTNVVYPAALVVSTLFKVEFSPAGLGILPTLTPPFTLSAKLGTMDVFSSTFTDAKTVDNLSIVQPTVTGQPKSLPWTLYGDLEWISKGSKTEQPQYKCTTSIELYVLPPYLPSYFHRSGVALTLLRLSWYLPTWMREVEQKPGGNHSDWPAFVVKSIFSHPTLEYETYSGICKYTSWDLSQRIDDIFHNRRGINCWLDLWLSDTCGVTGNGAKHSVNCYDLAALCQVLVSLGVDAKQQPILMRLCNNPFYGDDPRYDTEMYTIQKPPRRSKFGNHMFLTITKGPSVYVLDACCGPQLGDQLLLDYPAAVIDTTAELYTAPDLPGTLTNITDGIGVEDTVISRCFERVGDPDPKSTDLLDKLALEMGADGTWAQPYLAAPSGNWNVSATWTFQPRKKDEGKDDKDGKGSWEAREILKVNLFTYEKDYQVRAAVERRKSNVSGWITTPRADLDIYRDMGSGSTRVFGDEACLYVATIEARLGKSSTTKVFKKKFLDVLNTTLTKRHPSSTFIKGVRGPPQPPQVGKEFVITLETTLAGRTYWRGYNVRVTSECALLLTSSKENDNINFHFLTRSTGKVKIILTMYGGSLDSERWDQEVDIVE